MKRIIAAIAALALAAPAVASAQSWNGGGGHHGGGYNGGGYYNGGSRYNGGGRSGGGYAQQGWRGDRDWRGGRSNYRSAGWYSRGSYLPPYYRGYAVSDYGRYHLRQPPRGYYWYRTGNDFVLAALATGLIYDLATSGGYGNDGYSYDYPGDYGYGQYGGYGGYGY